jgi:hypothetical protein
MPSPSINGIIGRLGTFNELSELTVIFSPVAGTIIFPEILFFVAILDFLMLSF